MGVSQCGLLDLVGKNSYPGNEIHVVGNNRNPACGEQELGGQEGKSCAQGIAVTIWDKLLVRN